MSIDRELIRVARATLALLDPTRNEALHQLLAFFGPVEALAWLNAPTRTPAEQAEILRGVSIDRLLAHHATVAARTEEAGARVLIPEDDAWPARLDDLSRVAFTGAPSSALCLWIRGNGDPSTALRRVVAVTGARAATAYGQTVAGDVSYGLAGQGWSVAAGSSVGIDSAALRGALAAGGPAIAVLPAGIDRPYPAANTDVLARVADRGLLISADPPDSATTSRRFVAARRLLAGLGHGAVVVEAAAGSQALTVLDETISRGRRAMVVPGPVTSAMSSGTHAYLREHPQARLVRHTADIVAELPSAG
ncbi:DNA-processing protein DprA [Paractinoplanes rishiriensis]|uniref:Smf/DprA SLOG domain-containing protein n=1 Tax=Paractinoplanes rishiriensis TaxID=1050105 RepID=A0A919KD92_9ACTN|nr:DNA-processing protein DprA [Actinoplanes rishiriensis]GIF02012.1 hypothetical protein Ari01nite_94760 [Actinoplanes rishiriensis]